MVSEIDEWLWNRLEQKLKISRANGGSKMAWIQSIDFRSYKGEHVYLLIALCRTATITMYKTVEDARKQKDFIDRIGCGGVCSRQHCIIKMKSETAKKLNQLKADYKINSRARWLYDNRPHE